MFITLVLFVVLVVIPLGGAVSGASVMYWRSSNGLPQPLDTIYLDPITGPTQFFDRSGQTLLFSVQDPLGDERAWITLDALPDYVMQATLSAEDPYFLTRPHPGLFESLSRLWYNAISGPLPPDPTLTGRLVRNVIAPPGDVVSVWDREREIALVAEINRRYTPQQILEWHLNTDYYGNEAYGIEAAARVYLGKSAVDLTLDEAALLAAIPPAPQYNPIDNETAARGRQDDILRALLQMGEITPQDYDVAVTTLTPIQADAGQSPETAPEFSIYARQQAKEILDGLGHDGARLVARGGLNIITTLDLDLYYQSECALRTQLARLRGDNTPQSALNGDSCQGALYLPPSSPVSTDAPPNSGALAIIDVQSGEIKSMVGSAAVVTYQPGPTLQPFVYFEGFIKGGRNAAEMVSDIPISFPGAAEGLIYTPRNSDGQFRGPMNLRDAMGAGLLPPAVQVANRLRIDNILIRAHQLGLTSLDINNRYDLSLLERGGEVSVLDIAYAYSVLSSMGEMRGIQTEPIGRNYRVRNPVAVLRIEDQGGNILWEYSGDQFEPDCAVASNCTLVYPEQVGYLINHILSDGTTRERVLGQSAASLLNTSRPTAVVNGKTSDNRDAWTAGYTPQIITVVHVGREDKSMMTLDMPDLRGAAPVWRALMDYIANRDALPAVDWARPEGIVNAVVCERSGLLPNGVCPVRTEIFIEGFQPAQVDTYWQSFDINTQTGQLATLNTPAGIRSQRVYFVPPPDVLDWWRANNQPLPPVDYDTVSRPELLGSAAILQPAPFAYVGGEVDIRGSMDTTNMQYYQLAYGKGLIPDQWTQIGSQQTAFTRGNSLGIWNTAGLDGLYSLQLTVVLNDNTRETDVRQVTIDNIAPMITLSAGGPGKIYRWPDEQSIELTAEVQDNLAIDHVEFYHNGQFIGSDEQWPYGFSWKITGVGNEVFSAVAFDAVGNQANAEITVQVIR
jgi:membrane peptidoglycan carboxypeptidase